jgi:cytidylate kinase
VRRFLVDMQRRMGAGKGVVMDGRDIGTVVFPDAELKIFMTASPEIRATRRFRELQQMGVETTFEAVLDNLNNRDQQDSSRADSPLRMAEGARLLDNSSISIAEQADMALGWAREAMEGNGIAR